MRCVVCSKQAAPKPLLVHGGSVYMCYDCEKERECDLCCSVNLSPPRYVHTLHLRFCQKCVEEFLEPEHKKKINNVSCYCCKTTFREEMIEVDAIQLCDSCYRLTQSSSPFADRKTLASSS